ncbi:zinc finger MYND domain-containing protein 15 [Ahaetulla prasina]|uniref:zinc finger MYND domain-containing protein 15 n=1 Tax=Ahaetulla prasina TaxID=499056 RepID=UPI002647A32B|nr:zinc finger MYND domain-containing protein 15 [Ahaetulla prasina]
MEFVTGYRAEILDFAELLFGWYQRFLLDAICRRGSERRKRQESSIRRLPPDPALWILHLLPNRNLAFTVADPGQQLGGRFYSEEALALQDLERFITFVGAGGAEEEEEEEEEEDTDGTTETGQPLWRVEHLLLVTDEYGTILGFDFLLEGFLGTAGQEPLEPRALALLCYSMFCPLGAGEPRRPKLLTVGDPALHKSLEPLLARLGIRMSKGPMRGWGPKPTFSFPTTRVRACHVCKRHSFEGQITACQHCRAVFYCSEKCRKLDWSRSPEDIGHQFWCQRMAGYMSHARELANFPFTFAAEVTSDTFNKEGFLLARGLTRGYWVAESMLVRAPDYGLGLQKGPAKTPTNSLLDRSSQLRQSLSGIRPTQYHSFTNCILYIFGYNFGYNSRCWLSPLKLFTVDGLFILRNHPWLLSIRSSWAEWAPFMPPWSGNPFEALRPEGGTALPPAPPEPPTPRTFFASWKEYYQWRGLPLGAPLAVLLTYPLTAYYIITQLAPQHFPELNILNKQSLKIHLVEAGKEFGVLMVFWELSVLLPHVSLELLFVGDTLPPELDGQQFLLQRDEERGVSVLPGLAPRAKGGRRELQLGFSARPYHLLQAPKPDLVIAPIVPLICPGFNSGFALKETWLSALPRLQSLRVPAYFTECSAYSCAVDEAAVSMATGGTASPAQINPFRSPFRQAGIDNAMPWYCNAFIFHLIYKASANNHRQSSVPPPQPLLASGNPEPAEPARSRRKDKRQIRAAGRRRK